MTEGDLTIAALLIVGFATLGVFITLGNIRQARAIREVGEILHDWAIRHIQLSRVVAASSIHIEDPIVWFRDIFSRITLPSSMGRGLERIRGANLIQKGNGWLLFQGSPDQGSSDLLILVHHPDLDPRPLERGSRFEVPVLPRGFLQHAMSFRLSPLNVGPTFDLELEVAWKRLFPNDRPPTWLWMRVYQKKDKRK